jgi:hypothetical protein
MDNPQNQNYDSYMENFITIANDLYTNLLEWFHHYEGDISTPHYHEQLLSVTPHSHEQLLSVLSYRNSVVLPGA